MSLNLKELHEIDKHLQYRCGKRIIDLKQKRMLKGTYKEVGSDEEQTGDNFFAYELMNCSALEVYECYVKYFNITIQDPHEKERIPVRAEWTDEYKVINFREVGQ
jgi:hypothetical protein